MSQDTPADAAKKPIRLPARRQVQALTPTAAQAVAEVMRGLTIQAAIPREMLPAIEEMLGYIYTMDERAQTGRGRR